MSDTTVDALAAALRTFPVPETMEELQSAIARTYEDDAAALAAALADAGYVVVRAEDDGETPVRMIPE